MFIVYLKVFSQDLGRLVEKTVVFIPLGREEGEYKPGYYDTLGGLFFGRKIRITNLDVEE